MSAVSFGFPGRSSGNSFTQTFTISSTAINATVRCSYSAPNGGSVRVNGTNMSNGETVSLNNIKQISLSGTAYDGGISGSLSITY